jgi:hypothetical protein
MVAMPLASALEGDDDPASEDRSGTRASWTVTAFQEAAVPIDVNFEDDRENSTFHISSPNSAKITAASMTIEGMERPEMVGTVWNFSDNTTASGWEWYTTSYPPTNSPSSIGGQGFSDQAYQDVDSLDGAYLMTSTSWQNVPPPHQYPYHLFDIQANVTDAARLKVEWHGWGRNDDNASNTHGAELWIWNYTGREWEFGASYAANDTGDQVRSLSKTIMEPSYYTDRYGHMVFLAFGQRDEGGPRVVQGSIGTDYAALTVYRNGTIQQPTDVTVAIGGYAPFWSHVGAFTTQVTLGDTEGLKAAIQTFVASFPPSTDNVLVPFVFTVDAPTFAEVRVVDLSVTIQEYDNQPPVFLGTTDIAMSEDEDLMLGLDLRDHYDDDLQGSDLNYSVVFEENASLVHAVMHDDGYNVDFYAVAKDWAGTVSFRFNASDTWGLHSISGDFQVTVHEVNDPPMLVDPGDQFMDEDALYGFNMTAIDPDLPYGDVLTFEDDTDLFAIDQATGRIEFTPSQSHIGEYNVTITVRDARGAEDSLVISFYITDINDPPTIIDPGVLEVLEDGRLDFNFSAVDEDGEDTFSWILVGGVGTMTMGNRNGRLTWIPTGEHVGLVNVSVIAIDQRGAADQINVSIEVININDPPVLDDIPLAQLTEGHQYIYTITFADPDLEENPSESHTFAVEPPVLTISHGGVVDFTPTNDDVGDHLLDITITDSAGATSTKQWEVRIANVNEPPVIDQVASQNWREDTPAYLVIVATDPDKGDRLVYSDSTSIFDIDPNTGEINFTPLQVNVGTHQLRIIVTDSGGLYADVYFDVTIGSFNDAPTVGIRTQAITDKLKEGDQISLAAEVEDPDNVMQDFAFTWLLDGKPVGEEDTLVLSNLKPGNHTVTLTVNDGDNQVSDTYTFSVEEVEETFPWMFVVTVVVVLVVVAFVGMRVLKGLRSEPPPEEEAPVPEPEKPPEESVQDAPTEDNPFKNW